MQQTSIWETAKQIGAMTPMVEIKRKVTLKLLTTNMESALLFYKVFFDAEPITIDSEHAVFEMENPPLNIMLVKNKNARVGAGHFGIQVKSTSIVREMSNRLDSAGFKLIKEDEADCCYALQTKIWAADPDGYRWEIFVVTEAETEQGCGPDCICHADFDRTMLANQ